MKITYLFIAIQYDMYYKVLLLFLLQLIKNYFYNMTHEDNDNIKIVDECSLLFIIDYIAIVIIIFFKVKLIFLLCGLK